MVTPPSDESRSDALPHRSASHPDQRELSFAETKTDEVAKGSFGKYGDIKRRGSADENKIRAAKLRRSVSPGSVKRGVSPRAAGWRELATKRDVKRTTSADDMLDPE